MYWDYLKNQQILLNTFIEESFLELKIIKIFSLILAMALEFSLNALFYTDSYISDMYYNNGVLDFFSSLPKSLYSSALGFGISFLLSYLSNSKDKLLQIIKRENQDKKGVDPEKKEKHKKKYTEVLDKVVTILKVKLTFFFIFDFILMIFFLYYCATFCAVYKNSQVSWVIGSLTSLGISLLVPFFFCFIVSTMRYFSLKLKSKCLFYSSLFIGKIM